LIMGQAALIRKPELSATLMIHYTFGLTTAVEIRPLLY